MIDLGFNTTMQKTLNIYLQYLLPQHLLSRFAGLISNSRIPWLKNWIIRRFIKQFNVDMSNSIIEDPTQFPSFNSFFTRHIKPESRPIVEGKGKIASPADGFISQFGRIDEDKLFQAKGFYFKLADLLGSKDDAKDFLHGDFVTVYLAPRNYHRVHMPLAGTLVKTLYIPGKLFSVNQKTVRAVSSVFTRNERLVCLFDTEEGRMAVILVGAMLVGSIHTVWKNNQSGITLARGEEMGHFQMGSTVIVLFAKNNISWETFLDEDVVVKMGQCLGTIN